MVGCSQTKTKKLMANVDANKDFEKIFEINSKSSHVEWDTLNRLAEFLKSLGLKFRVVLDGENQKCLRLALPEGSAIDENVVKVSQFVKSIVTDAEVTPIGVPMISAMLSQPIPVATQRFEVGQKAPCNNAKPLPGNDVGPALVEGDDYEVFETIEDSRGNQHLNVGLKSTISYVTSYETGEKLPRGNEVHWIHPSRLGAPKV